VDFHQISTRFPPDFHWIHWMWWLSVVDGKLQSGSPRSSELLVVHPASLYIHVLFLGNVHGRHHHDLKSATLYYGKRRTPRRGPNGFPNVYTQPSHLTPGFNFFYPVALLSIAYKRALIDELPIHLRDMVQT